MKQQSDATDEDQSTSGLLIDAIETTGMQEARQKNQNAFALLKSTDGTPSLVKIFDLPNNKQVGENLYFCAVSYVHILPKYR